MREEIRIELDSVKKHRNAQEWRNVNRASACGIEVTGDGTLIDKLCQSLIDAGHAPDTPASVWRNGTPVFRANNLRIWAKGSALAGAQPEHLKGASKRRKSAQGAEV